MVGGGPAAEERQRCGAVRRPRLLVELPPHPRLEKLVGVVRALEGVVDGFDVPDAPLGLVLPQAVVLAARLRCVVRGVLVAHMRVIDHSLSGAVYMAEAAKAVGLDGLVLLRGDRPALGDPLPHSTEEVARAIRGRVRGLRLGALLSPRRGPEEVRRRVRSRLFDFFLVLRATEASDEALSALAAEAGSVGAEVYGYVMVARRPPAGLEGQPFVPPERAAEEVERVTRLLGGVVLSVPEGLARLVEVARAVARAADG